MTSMREEDEEFVRLPILAYASHIASQTEFSRTSAAARNNWKRQQKYLLLIEWNIYYLK